MQKKFYPAKSSFSRYKLVRSNNTLQKSKNNIHSNNSEIITQMQKSVKVMESLTREVKNMSEETKEAANSTNQISWLVFLLTMGSAVIGIINMAISALAAIHSVQSMGLNCTTDQNLLNEIINKTVSDILNAAYLGCASLIIFIIVIIFLMVYLHIESIGNMIKNAKSTLKYYGSKIRNRNNNKSP